MAIANDYYSGIVKILLFDSLAEKQNPGSGYLGRGSGFIVTEDGVIFTNRHVIDFCVFGYVHFDYYDEQTDNTSSYREIYTEDRVRDSNVVKINRTGYTVPIIQVYSGKGEEDYKLYYAKVLTFSNGSFDGAMLKIVSDLNGNPVNEKFFSLPVGNSDSTEQGEDLCVYGYPSGHEGGFDIMLDDMSTLTVGKHSGFDYLFDKDFGHIKTDASINSGNSGGPVFNQDNKVIGIATATATTGNIGLVGGINAMYYVAAPQFEVLQILVAKGLKAPKRAGSVSTIGGEHLPMLSQKEIEALNKKKQSDLDALIAKKEEEKQREAYRAYVPVPQNRLVINLGGAVGISSYKRGNVDAFWQTINHDPSLAATKKGNPFIWNVDLQMLAADKKEKNFFGWGLHFFKTSNSAIAATHEYSGVTNEISFRLMLINFSLVYSRAIGKKTFLIVDPSVVYVGLMKGGITAYGSTYNVKAGPFGSFGWQVSAGTNYMVTKSIGISLRAGYRALTLQETHKDDRPGYEKDYSFFANGIDGETTMVKWNGIYFTTGIVLWSANRIKKGYSPFRKILTND